MTSASTSTVDAVDELEHRFGNPLDATNPCGFTSILAADERDELPPAGVRMLDDFGLGAEFVPTQYGGRLSDLQRLIEVMRSVYRHDPSMGLGYGFSSFIASLHAWVAGSPEQCRAVADLLLRNGKIAAAYHELDHGNDMGRVDFEAVPTGDGLVLNGRKEVVTNIEPAQALVLFARTDRRPGSRSHSQILVDKAQLPPDRIRYLPRFGSTGLRGVRLGGIEFRDCPLPADNIIGVPGGGLETALRAFQITRTVLPAMMAGQVDTGLRITMRHALGRRLYGEPAATLPAVRSVLVGVFVDLLVVDCLTRAVARAIHLLPGETSVYGSVVKHFGAKVLMDAMDELAAVLGAQFYLRRGDASMFQKMLRDLAPAGFGHAGRSACETTVLPQLPLLARRSWRASRESPADLFSADAAVPALRFDRLSVTADGQDRLTAELAAALDGLAGDADPDRAALRPLIESFVADLRGLAEDCARLPACELGVLAGPGASALVGRYGVILAASACVGTWRHRRDGDRFLADPAWLLAALTRLSARLRRQPASLPAHLDERLFVEVRERYEDARGFDLTGRRLPDSRPDRPTERRPDRPTDRRPDRPTDRPTDRP